MSPAQTLASQDALFNDPVVNVAALAKLFEPDNGDSQADSVVAPPVVQSLHSFAAVNAYALLPCETDVDDGALAASTPAFSPPAAYEFIHDGADYDNDQELSDEDPAYAELTPPVEETWGL